MARGVAAERKKKGRGTNIGDMPKTNPADRALIYINDIGQFALSCRVRIVRTISCILKRHLMGPYANWSMVPAEGQEKYWSVFKETYRWDPDHEHEIHKMFKKESVVSMNRMFSTVGKNWRATEQTPDWLPKEHLKGLIAYWNSDAFKRRSAASKINRQKGPKITHRRGSNTFGQPLSAEAEMILALFYSPLIYY